MANLLLAKSFENDWPPQTIEGGTITTRSTTSMQYTSGAGYAVTLTGTGLTYDLDGMPSAGTVRGMTIFKDGMLFATFSAVSVDFGLAGVRLFGADRGARGFENPNGYMLVNLMMRGNDLVTGSNADDELRAGTGNDTFNAGAGFDYVEGDAGNDQLNGGDDRDTLSYSSSFFADSMAFKGINMDLLTGIVQDCWGGTDTVSGFEHYQDSALADTIRGSNDSESFSLTRGADFLDGRDGFDFLSYQDAENYGGKRGVNVNLATGVAIDSWRATDTLANIEGVEGTKFNDTMVGSNNADLFVSTEGVDSYNGGAGIDTLAFWNNGDRNGAGGISINMTKAKAILNDGFGNVETAISFEKIEGSRFNDTMVGGTGDEMFFGDDGADSLNGGAGHDELTGMRGNDTLIGGLGDDFLSGGADFDRLSGGSGVDDFFFGDDLWQAGVDVITDFSVVDDRIVVSADWGGGFTQSDLVAGQFRTGLGATTATTADQRFIYNRSTGDLYFDHDGLGGDDAVQFATLSNRANISFQDFIIVDVI